MQDETAAQEEVSLRDYLDLLRRRSAIIIQTLVAALVIGIVVAVVSTNVYSSGGRLLVTPNVPVVRNSTDPLGNISEQTQVHNIETQLEVLMNGDLLSEAYKASGVTPGDGRVHPSVSRRSEDIDIIDIGVEAHKSEIAQAVAENMMDIYIKEEAKSRTGDLGEAVKYAEQQLTESNAALKDYSLKLLAFENSHQVPDYNARQAALASNLAGLEAESGKLRSQIAGTQKFMDKTEANIAKTPANLTTYDIVTNPAIEGMRAKLSDLQVERKTQSTRFKDEHPTMKALDRQIREQKYEMASLARTLKSARISTNPQIEASREQLLGYDAQMAQLNESLRQNQALAAGVRSNQLALGKESFTATTYKQKMDFYEGQVKQLESRLAELKLRQIAQPKPISILNHAGLNTVPVRPKRPMIIMMSLLAGLFLGVCFALLAEFMDDRVNSPEDARRILAVPALGYIPRIDKEDQRMLTSKTAGGSLLESYRVLRSNVRFAAAGEPLRMIMVTSTAPGEGKSVTAANLAIAMALDGKKVILVDCDLRRPTVHEKFGIRGTPGLTNVLVGAMDLDLALQDTEVENLKLLASGPIPPNPAELLNSRAFEVVQEQLKDRSDVVILDSPPCLSVADAQVLAANVDGLIYVVQLGSTRKSALKHGNELLKQAHARILGVVYNKVQVGGRNNDYYYGYYSYYHKQELTGKEGAVGADSNGGRAKSQEWEGLLTQAKDTTPSATATLPEAPPKRGKSSESSREDRG